MKDFLQQLLSEVKHNRLSKSEATHMIRNAQAASRNKSVTKPASELLTYEEVWKEETVVEGTPLRASKLICFLTEPEHQQAVVEAVQAVDDRAQVAFVTSGESLQDVLGDERQDWQEVDALLYLCPMEDASYRQNPAALVALVQNLAKSNVQAKRLLLLGSYVNELERCHLESWIGLTRSLRLVLPQTQAAMYIQEGEVSLAACLPNILTELQAPSLSSVLYRFGKRYVCSVQPTDLQEGDLKVRAGGTYLITGGCGGLGYIFSEHFAKKGRVKLILTGRSALDDEKLAKLRALEQRGSQVLYVEADVCDADAMREGLAQASEQFGAIHGVVHAAGAASDRSILEKDEETFRRILDPKIRGTEVLDELLADEEALEFVCYFSSSSAILGDFGSGDYALANRFQMAYAAMRNEQGRPGKTLVINWPLWRDGGMGLKDEESAKIYLKTSGQRFLEVEEGLALFDLLLSQERTQHLVMAGERRQIEHFLIQSQSAPSKTPTLQAIPPFGTGRLPEMKGFTIAQCLKWDLQELIGGILKVSRDKLDVGTNLADFGFESISLAELAAAMTKHFGVGISPAVFFGHSTIQALVSHLESEHGEVVRAFYATERARPERVEKQREASLEDTIAATAAETSGAGPEPIAIIGMSGRFPQARNIDELWDILAEGRDAVTEIPEDRYDWREYYGERSCSKWLGAMPGVREFDPLFFEISPLEAEAMDPKQRLLLQEAWRALEDAGLGKRHLNENKIGMFVGVEEGDYQILSQGENTSITSNHNAILAARLPYFLNFSGPVMAINTACSSGLVVAHQACLSLRNGECDAAVVAGVSLLLTPTAYIGMTEAGMLSEDGKCKAFDNGANGLVPGEAVAVVVLKRLSQALADGDPIYAVIQGSGVNYDGKTNGITAPSTVAQANLIQDVYEQHKIDPEEIDYIVTHGTGTKLGDPVEVHALQDVFKRRTQKRGYCALTSTKTNLGHTFAASGLVNLISLVQAMRHETIPASLHCETENEYIHWENSAFYVNKTSKPWTKRAGASRVGALSSFGMSGTNAHMVVRSFEKRGNTGLRHSHYLLAFSAKTDEVLQEKLHDMIAMLESDSGVAGSLAQISYTLLEGRQHFAHRLAVVVQDVQELLRILKQAREGVQNTNVFRGKVASERAGESALQEQVLELAGKNGKLATNPAVYQEHLRKLAGLYCQGGEIAGDALFGSERPVRTNLPTYPFAREEYWAALKAEASAHLTASQLHPLLHRNTSDFAEQRFSSTFTGAEFFLADHVVKGQKVLPGVAYLEMARKAVEQTADLKNIRLCNVVWARPILVGEQPVEVHIALFPETGGEVGYEVYTVQNGEEIVHSQGRAVHNASAEDAPKWDLKELQASFMQEQYGATDCYAFFRAMGMEYGLAFQGIRQVQVGEGGVLAELRLPSVVNESLADYLLHPSLADASLQSAVGFLIGQNIFKTALPFALQELDVFGPCEAEMWALVRYSAGSRPEDRVQKLDVDLCDKEGRVRIRLKGCISRVLEAGEVAQGKRAAVSEKLVETSQMEVAASNANPLQERAIAYLKEQVSTVLKWPVSRLDAVAPLEQYGIDSVLVMKLTNELEKTFGSLPKTLFFEYQNLRDLAGYFLESHRAQLVRLTGDEEQAQDAAPVRKPVVKETQGQKELTSRRRQRFASMTHVQERGANSRQDVAIIGVSGRYPGARNLQEYWDNLREGKDSITEIPSERWDHSLYFDPDKSKPGKTNSKWGGFIDGVDQFDPLFFNISPREAEIMDPQERLFMQTVYEALEDAGYTRETLAKHRGLGLDGNVGVYVGVMYEEYQLYGAQETLLGRPIALAGSPASIANRVSYFFNLHGPSLAVDTMCSSSLTSIHLACQSLQQGGCELAIAGGVNVSIHPNKYILLGQGKFASSKGRCESFGEGGDGYVPGEGVGAVLLKPLSKAIEDGDQIHGVIKASAINHGGKTNGYTVPNPNAQANVIEQALRQAGLDPSMVSYIEAHGTGTSLGDPIEIAGLSKAFQAKADGKQPSCAIGSAKSNIGHCESAAGIAGVTKVLLQMKHGQLAPSLHAKVLNPNIDFEATPFVVQQELGEWKRPLVEIGGQVREVPRIAGISSFGAGGSNAHVIIEEYVPAESLRTFVEVTPQNPAVFVLSAKNEQRLHQQAENLLAVLQEGRFANGNFADMAYTLQVGREAMEERLAVVAGSVEQLIRKLEAFISGQEEISKLFRGQVKGNRDTFSLFAADEELQEAIEKWIQRRKLSKLADLWVKGLALDWSKLWGEELPRRISLPTYPFAKQRFWAPQFERPSVVRAGLPTDALHPLLHRNTSDFSEQRYSTSLTGQEFFLSDHLVKGQRVLPGVAYLEMARAAVEQAGGAPDEDMQFLRLQNVVWTHPVTVSERPVEVHIGLSEEDDGIIAYEIFSGVDANIHSQGRAVILGKKQVEQLPVEELKTACTKREISASDCYESFAAMGLEYGPAQRALNLLQVGDGQILARLTLPPCVMGTDSQYVLHPSLMDAALQAAIGFQLGEAPLKPALPFALEELDIYAPCTSLMWAHVCYSEGCKPGDSVQKLDIRLCDELGNVCAYMKGFSSRVLENQSDSEACETLMLAPHWMEQACEQQEATAYAEHLVLSCEFEVDVKGARCLTLQEDEKDIGVRFEAYAMQALEETQRILRGKPKGKVLVQIVVHAHAEQLLLAGLSGLLKTAQLENPSLIGQLIEVDKLEEVEEKLLAERDSGKEARIRYQGGSRQVAGWLEVPASVDADAFLKPWKEGGIYLLTGGAGGLGLVFAKEIATQAPGATLVLTGRSVLGESQLEALSELESIGARVVYKQVDVTDRAAVEKLFAELQVDYGTLNGILHSAGVIRDSFIIKKTAAELTQVLAPKVRGLVNLDVASRDMALDFFVLFSSLSGGLGNPGQADYAAANAFMDQFAAHRNRRVAVGDRLGRTLSINWPLWKEGGMHVDPETEKWMMQSLGMIPLRTKSGLRAFYEGLASAQNQVLVIEGKAERIKKKLLPAAASVSSSSVSGSVDVKADSMNLRERVLGLLTQTVSRLLKVDAEELDADAELSEYGFDSITLTEFANDLNEAYKLDLMPTIFFEHPTLHEFAGYLTDECRDVFASRLTAPSTPAAAVQAETARAEVAGSLLQEAPSTRAVRQKRRLRTAGVQQAQSAVTEPIAIVGMSGAFPQSRDMQEFWHNLVEGIDCISEIPPERWDWRAYFGDPNTEVNKTNIKWGGFLDETDKFDSLFFGISPLEAKLMDPQQRLLMTYVWKAIEDAGYSAQSLSGSKTGIFVGTGSSGYSGLITNANFPIEGYSSTGVVPSVGPNRMSYALNLHGPSEPVETACSSSLVAIHRAASAMQNGDCDMAVVGGVNTIVTPEAHISFNKAGMLSEDGRCKTFSDAANGYVRGEGVGMLVLKKLSVAERDGDHIYGLIRSTAVNHGGRANSLTAPNPKAQADLLINAYVKAGIDPRTITYIEAHGTGTELGDPIEINGLKSAFHELYRRTGTQEVESVHCGLGSVKTNIGHLELAAGIAGVIKVLLQLRHRTLAPTLHCEKVNPYIQLEGSPFYLVREVKRWEALHDAAGQDLPRRAGVSSFGFGGVNAHAIIEEYVPKERPSLKTDNSTKNPYIIALSAKNEHRLKEQVRQLCSALVAQKFAEEDLASIAYTLQVGRDAMEERLALVVTSVEELERKLKVILQGQTGLSEVWRGQVKRGKISLAEAAAHPEAREAEQIAELWVKGYFSDWNRLYGEKRPLRLSLPTYPFAKERHWISQAQDGYEALLFEPIWTEQDVVSQTLSPSIAQHLVLLCEVDVKLDSLQYRILQAGSAALVERFQAYAAQVFTEIQTLLQNKPKGNVLMQIAVSSQADSQLFTALSGLLRTAQLENPNFIGQVIEVKSGAGLEARLLENLHALQDDHVRYQNGKRLVAGWREVEMDQESAPVPWRSEGIYLLTGGVGGIGMIVAEEIARQAANPTLILVGRSQLSGAGQARLRKLRGMGACVEYRQVDVSFAPEVKRLIEGICEKYGTLHGILHGAGVNRDQFIFKKTQEELVEVLAPKVAGVVHLDAASKGLSLDFFVLFSSVAAVLGNLGQADYAAANAFLDAFANSRGGRILSINWPLWQEGGIRVDEETEKLLLQRIGMIPLRTQTGLQALYRALATGKDQVMVLEGKRTQIKQTLHSEPVHATSASSTVLLPSLEAALLHMVSELLNVKGSEIDPNAQMKEYGFDPYLISKLAQKINRQYGLELTPASLYETTLYQVIERIEAHAAKTKAAVVVKPVKEQDAALRAKTLHALKALFSETTGIRMNHLDAEELLERYGIDSLMISKLNQKLDVIFGNLSKTLFFEYRTLGAMTDYFVEEERTACQRWTGYEAPVVADASVVQAQIRHVERIAHYAPLPTKPNEREPIAIIGFSGRYPKSPSLQHYWENLKAGRDCVSEVPSERWSLDDFHHPNQDEAMRQGKSYSKWGGFIDGFADFDPQFFNLSPRETINIDPQERLFLEESWKALEDAGYTKERIASQHEGRVGVFVGVTKTGFELYGPDLWKQGEKIFPRTSFASVANRVSYFLNLNGPSMPVDTMCSSSLSAIYEACEHLYRGDCELAIAGGVNLYLHPSTYVFLSAQRMLSTDGQCKSFGLNGNGFVPGEGVGAVLLKPLSQALADGDQIHALIRAARVNHGGKTNGYTVPNPTAQGDLIFETLERAGLNARQVSYIEAHGTGTELGDPIEITGLTQAFRRHTKDTGFCAIGSVKSNIGHLEAAAGIAGLAKIVMQMKHGQLVPSLHTQQLNPNIQFGKTPFVVQQELSDWKRPMVEIDGKEQEGPRIAGLSSFGAGGANAHILIEEYRPEHVSETQARVTPQNPAVIVLSARQEEQLREQAQQLLEAIEDGRITEANLSDAAYTLQVGREPMEERLALIVGSVQEMTDKLTRYAAGKTDVEDLYRGQFRRNNEDLMLFAADEDMALTIEAWISKRKFSKLLSLWVKGLTLDWKKLHGAHQPRLISLPSYPFAKQRIWLPSIRVASAAAQAEPVEPVAPVVPVAPVAPVAPAEPVTLVAPVAPASAVASEGEIKSIGSAKMSSNLSARTNGIALQPLSAVREPFSERSATRQPIQLSPVGQATTAPAAAPAQIKVTVPASSVPASIPAESLQKELQATLAEALFLQPSDVDVNKAFVDMGLDSIVSVEWVRVINQQYGTDISATKVYDYPTIREFASYIANVLSKNAPKAASTSGTEPASQIKASKIAPSVTAAAPHEQLRESLADALFLQAADIDLDKKFVDMGLDSIVGVEWIRVINQQHGTDIPATKVYDYPTLREFAAYLSKQLQEHPIAEQPATELSVDDLLLQVYEGNLGSEQADQLLQQFKIKEEVK
ncbi:SDR family NAD(P)-dependent oxidoreductase [Paenibacillus sp. KS-LC4]|uniref:SDR family NAD(P)-dependent oxidoreductase n=1 Tax=Paenibacillus sp. KS-LC4 TaxID=2979727 RepID=UPI0030D21FA9